MEEEGLTEAHSPTYTQARSMGRASTCPHPSSTDIPQSPVRNPHAGRPLRMERPPPRLDPPHLRP